MEYFLPPPPVEEPSAKRVRFSDAFAESLVKADEQALHDGSRHLMSALLEQCENGLETCMSSMRKRLEES